MQTWPNSGLHFRPKLQSISAVFLRRNAATCDRGIQRTAAGPHRRHRSYLWLFDGIGIIESLLHDFKFWWFCCTVTCMFPTKRQTIKNINYAGSSVTRLQRCHQHVYGQLCEAWKCHLHWAWNVSASQSKLKSSESCSVGALQEWYSRGIKLLLSFLSPLSCSLEYKSVTTNQSYHYRAKTCVQARYATAKPSQRQIRAVKPINDVSYYKVIT